MSYLLDTNILVRWFSPTDPQHAVVAASLISLSRAHEDVSVCSQNIIEFWAVATRPLKTNGLGWTPKQAEAAVERIRGLYQWLPDSVLL